MCVRESEKESERVCVTVREREGKREGRLKHPVKVSRFSRPEGEQMVLSCI